MNQTISAGNWRIGLAAVLFGVGAAMAVEPPVQAHSPSEIPPAVAPATIPSADDYPIADDPDLEHPEKYLGERVVSKFQGIALRGPANCKLVPRRTSADVNEVANFINEKDSWLMIVTRVSQENPIPLTTEKDASGLPHTGLMEMSVAKIKADVPGVKILASDVGAVGQYLVGKIVYRYSIANASWIRQMAIIRGGNRLYYVITLTTPSGKTEGDESEQLAANTFKAVVDSVNLLNMTSIADEQTRRLVDARGLEMDWTKLKIEKVLIPRQWLRVLRNGKDVGWTFIEELTGRQRRALNGAPLPPVPGTQPTEQQVLTDDGLIDLDGFVVYSRSFISGDADHPESALAHAQGGGAATQPVTAKSYETAAETFLSYDRKTERFVRDAVVTDSNGHQSASLEFGQSHQRTRIEYKNVQPGQVNPDKNDPRNPVGYPVTNYELSVQFSAKQGIARPVTHDLPPFYISDALVDLLPRLVPLVKTHPNDKFSYMFCTYVHESQEIMTFYVDVGDPMTVTLAGEEHQGAVPVSVRLGYEGAPTVHYMTPDGHYLGTVIANEGITVVPTDPQALLKLWPKADLQLRQMQSMDEVVRNLRTDETRSAPAPTHTPPSNDPWAHPPAQDNITPSPFPPNNNDRLPVRQNSGGQ